MTSTRVVLSAGLVLSFAYAAPARAQIETLRRTAITAPAPDSTIDRLTKRIEALENLVAQLQQRTAFIKSVSPLVLDAATDQVTIRGGQILLEPRTGFTLRAGTDVGILAGNTLELRGTSNMTLRSSAQLLVEAGSVLDLKGSSVRHNGGSVPIACAASTVNGQTITPCSATVGVPGPGQ